jgi:hypothetical protein
MGNRWRTTAQFRGTTALPTLTVLKGGHILGHWKHIYSEGSSTEVLGFCDWTGRVAVVDTEYHNTCDVELQQN